MSLASVAAALADRYTVERELGGGGMATVYLAEDVKHHRRIAVKVLRPELAAAVGADRFLREIDTTANLRHPHILPLYDSGEAHGFLYYVMPLVEGESLRERLDRERQLPIGDALRITAEVADALAYAHAHGVIHRDIKPANILLESGHAVIADFGIAKALLAAGGETLTQTGVAIGTPQYMSPEQAAAERTIDGRSDQYSLGCVLFEMLGGQPPFSGPTIESVVHQHLAIEAPPITNLRRGVPPTIAAALQRALAKTPADRFNTLEQFVGALGPRSSASDQPGVLRPTGRDWRSWPLIVGAAGVLVLAALAAVLLPRRGPPIIQLGRQLRVTHEPGLEIDPALSPDGRFLAYAGGEGVLMVRPVDGGDAVSVIHGGDGKGRWPAWTSDGQRLVFLSPRGVEVVSALGGSPRLIMAAVTPERGITLAPDGRTVAFVLHDSLYSVPLAGGTPHPITGSHELHSPAWSPDGRWIAFVSGNVQYVSLMDRSLGNIAPCRIQVVRASGGIPQPASDERSMNVSPAWTASGALLYVSDRDGSRDLYQVRLTRTGAASGPPVRLTTGLNVLGLAVSHDGSRMAYSTLTETSNVWSLAIPATGARSVSEARQVTSADQTIENLDVSHDGRWLAFSSALGALSQVYRLQLNHPGAEPEQLTSDTVDSFWSSWSTDDRQIAFHRFHGERRQVFVMSADGSGQVPVTDGSQDVRSPDWSPDGRRLSLLANWETRPTLEIVTRAPNGTWSPPRTMPIIVGTDTVSAGLTVWSPDGHWLACGCGAGGLVLLPSGGGPAHRLTSPYSTAGWGFPQWSADSKTVYYLTADSTGVAAVVADPISGAPPHVVARFDDPDRPWHRFGFRVRNGTMYFTLGDQESDIWVTDIASKTK